MEKFIAENKIHAGHRSRMKHKLISHGQHIFDTYELLEMLLYYVIPYKDTNPISKNLLYAFGGPLLSPMLGGLAMSLSSVFVVGNALKLKTKKL